MFAKTLIALFPLAILSVLSRLALAVDSPIQPGSKTAVQESTVLPETPSVTVLQIICTIPEELEHPKRVVNGNIGWSVENTSGGETVNGEAFSFELSSPKVEIQLKALIPINAEVRVQFAVSGNPSFKSRFTSGEWLLRTRVRDDASSKLLVVSLSSFKNLSKIRIYPNRP